MPPIGDRLKDVLDESRLVMLGAQLLLGLQYRAAFEPGFDRLPPVHRWLDGAALLLILAAVATLLSVPSFHQLVAGGQASGRALRHASGCVQAALLPLAPALGIDLAIALRPAIGDAAAGGAGALFAAAALAVWFVVPLLARRTVPAEESMADREQPLENRLQQALTELRVVLPGAQALFLFQAAAVLTEGFDRLPEASRYLHLAGTCAVAACIVLLVAPASYHRIAAAGNAERRVLDYAVRMMLPAQGLLALGLVGDTYVMARKITEMPGLALGVAAAALLGFAVLLYGVPLLARAR